jgi:hypothetical protein
MSKRRIHHPLILLRRGELHPQLLRPQREDDDDSLRTSRISPSVIMRTPTSLCLTPPSLALFNEPPYKVQTVVPLSSLWDTDWRRCRQARLEFASQVPSSGIAQEGLELLSWSVFPPCCCLGWWSLSLSNRRGRRHHTSTNKEQQAAQSKA